MFSLSTMKLPALNFEQPIRTAFTHYGKRVTRRPLVFLIISVATAATLLYPFPFLYSNEPMTGTTSKLPNHEWISAQALDGDDSATPDVIMRSFWVHGMARNRLGSYSLICFGR